MSRFPSRANVNAATSRPIIENTFELSVRKTSVARPERFSVFFPATSNNRLSQQRQNGEKEKKAVRKSARRREKQCIDVFLTSRRRSRCVSLATGPNFEVRQVRKPVGTNESRQNCFSPSGKTYFYNCKTEVSQWEKPKGWPSDA